MPSLEGERNATVWAVRRLCPRTDATAAGEKAAAGCGAGAEEHKANYLSLGGIGRLPHSTLSTALGLGKAAVNDLELGAQGLSLRRIALRLIVQRALQQPERGRLGKIWRHLASRS